ncbi:MAG: ankyrin repeat domain-containing protein [Leptospirales bacterium]|nr:ankyrin repeat domain-containing protein [Leptospirales bacterium]
MKVYKAAILTVALFMLLGAGIVRGQALDAGAAENRRRRAAEIEKQQAEIGPLEQRLIEAAQKGAVSEVNELLTRGAKAEVFAMGGPFQSMTPLMFAAAEGHTEVCRLLLDHGAAVDSISYDPFVTALHLAASFGRTETVRLLLQRGADFNKIEYFDGGTPLWRAASNGHLQTIQVLEAAGANLHFVTEYGKDSTLHAVIGGSGDLATARYLLERGAAVNAQNSGGETPLYLAIARNNLDVVQLLLSSGADRTVVTRGKTPLQWAQQWQRSGMFEVLEAPPLPGPRSNF